MNLKAIYVEGQVGDGGKNWREEIRSGGPMVITVKIIILKLCAKPFISLLI